MILAALFQCGDVEVNGMPLDLFRRDAFPFGEEAQ
jgi:hypothetical protein